MADFLVLRALRVGCCIFSKKKLILFVCVGVQATCSKQPCLSCAGNPLLSSNSTAAAAAPTAAETEHRIYLRSHRQRRNQQLLQQQQQQQAQHQQQQHAANLNLRPWTRSRAQQVLHHYQLEQLHSPHAGNTSRDL